MLYLTTRDNKNAYTAHKTLCADIAPDGGLYVPYKLPFLEKSQLGSIMQGSFGETVAQILNLFFAVRLTGWDIDFRIGRAPISVTMINRKIAIAELWKNPGAGAEFLIDELYRCVATNKEHSAKPTMWARTVIRIAILFGLYGQIKPEDCDGTAIDISVNMQDVTELLSAWYARAIGLPIGQIICCCDTGDAFWDMLHSGVLNTKTVGDTHLACAELLIRETLGDSQAQQLVSVIGKRGTFAVSEEDHRVLSAGIYPVAVGPGRADSVRSSVRRSAGYSIDQCAAITYGGLQDYRAQTGESCLTMLLSQSAPDDA